MRELLALPDPPTAIFSANNRVSVGVIRGLGQDRHRVAMVGFDDVELADVLDVPLTVVRTDAAALGRTGAELLFRRLNGWTGESQRIALPTALVPRGSGEIPPPPTSPRR